MLFIPLRFEWYAVCDPTWLIVKKQTWFVKHRLDSLKSEYNILISNFLFHFCKIKTSKTCRESYKRKARFFFSGFCVMATENLIKTYSLQWRWKASKRKPLKCDFNRSRPPRHKASSRSCALRRDSLQMFFLKLTHAAILNEFPQIPT